MERKNLSRIVGWHFWSMEYTQKQQPEVVRAGSEEDAVGIAS